MKKTKEILYNIFIYSTIILFSFINIVKVLDSDLFFDLRSAKDLLTYGLDMQDHMSMFSGLKYLYHHWLYDLIIYPIFNLGEYTLVFIFMLLIFISINIIIYKYINKKINNKFIALILVILFIFTTGKYFSPRVKSLTYLLIILEYIMIEKLYDTGKFKYAIISILISILFVNLQFPLWILIPVIYLPYIAQIVIKFIKDKFNLNIFDNKLIFKYPKNMKIFLITFGLILLSCFISPYGILPYAFGFKTTSIYNSVYSHISEMEKVVLTNVKVIFVYFFAFIILLLNKKKIKASDLFYLLGISLFGILYYRNIIYIYIFYMLIIPPILFENCQFKLPKIKINMLIIYPLLIGFEIFFLISGILAVNFKNYQYGIDGGGEPIESANYIIENLDYKNIKLYNCFNIGSYLAYREIPVFIDSRVEVYVPEFNGTNIDAFRDSNKLKPEELIEKYNYDYFLVVKSEDMYEYLSENNYELLNVEFEYYYLYKNNQQ